MDGFNIHIGNRFNEHFGLELGYFRTEKLKMIDGASLGLAGSVKGRLSGISLDALGYLPVNESKTFELIGTAGVAYLKGEVDSTLTGAVGSEEENEVSFRIGAGAQYNVTDNLNIRGLIRYQTADLDDVADDLVVGTLGVNYSF